MSVINRMLEDLEQRQGHPEGGRRDELPPGSMAGQGEGRGRLLLVAVAFGVGLVVLVVGALAWRTAGDLSLPLPEQNVDTRTPQAQQESAEKVAENDPAVPEAASASRQETGAPPEGAVLRETDTLIKPYGARIAMSFDRPLEDLPIVRHDNRRTDFWLPGTRLDGNTLAFLAGLDQAGQVESTRGADGTSLSIEPAEGTRLDVEADRHGIVLAFTSSRSSSVAAPREASSSMDSKEEPGEETKDRGTSPSPKVEEGGRASRTEQTEQEPSPEKTDGSGETESDDTPPSMGIRPASASLRQQVREHIAQGDIAGARERLESALSRDSSRQDLWRLLAKLDMQEGQDGQAVERLAALARPEPATLALLGLAARRAGQPDVAVRAYGGALEARPHRADWWAGLGIAMESVGRPDGAGSAYRRAVGEGGLSDELGAYVRQRLGALGGAAPGSG
ncbi:MAG: tetratricopeptide repeat protein [Pseudomonadota bacterium]